MAELRATLSYDRLAQRIQRSGLTLDELLMRVLNVAIVLEPASVLIITGDADLLVLNTYQNIHSSPRPRHCAGSKRRNSYDLASSR